MYLKILLTTTLSLGIVFSIFCQSGFPFELETNNHSSYHGLVTNNDDYLITEEAENIRFEDEYTEKTPIPAPVFLTDNNGNPISETLAYSPNKSKEEIAAIRIIYTDANYTCYNNLELTLGFKTYSMSGSELNLSLPKGRYFFKIQGDLACDSTDGCQINNTGIVDIDENGTLYLSWQVTDYQSCWMNLRSSTYYDKVID
jgi:hypothetical protein